MLDSNLHLKGDIDSYFRANFEEVKELSPAIGRKIYVIKTEAKALAAIFRKRETHFGFLYFYNQILGLKNVGFLSSQFSSIAPMKKRLPLHGGEIIYIVWHSKVYISQINFFRDYDASEKRFAAGAYVVKKDKEWDIVADSGRVTEVGYIKTNNLAVNGLCKGIDQAAKYMPDFIEYGFGKEALKNTYTLFYNPRSSMAGGEWRSLMDGMGVSSGGAKKLAEALILSSQKNVEKGINLTVHDNGHSLLKSALKIACQRGEPLERFTVFYANPVNNVEIVDKWRKRSGMKLAAKAPLINTLSAGQYLASGNFISQPVVACRADPKNRVASLYNSGLSALGMAGAVSVGTDLVGAAGWAFAVAPMLLGQSRALNQKVIDNRGKALQEGARHLTQQTKRVVWDPVHKMLVRE